MRTTRGWLSAEHVIWNILKVLAQVITQKPKAPSHQLICSESKAHCFFRLLSHLQTTVTRSVSLNPYNQMKKGRNCYVLHLHKRNRRGDVEWYDQGATSDWIRVWCHQIPCPSLSAILKPYQLCFSNSNCANNTLNLSNTHHGGLGIL